MADKNALTLGGGILKINAVDVGYLNGSVNLVYTGESVDFTPNNKLGNIRRFKSSERVILTAEHAEINAANLRLAMGQSTANISSNSFPSYDPSNYVISAGSSYDIMKFGGILRLLRCPCSSFTLVRKGQQARSMCSSAYSILLWQISI